MEPLTSILMWRYERWRCVYEALSDTTGRLLVYSGNQAVLEMPKVSSTDAELRATGLRTLTQFATDAPGRQPG